MKFKYNECGVCLNPELVFRVEGKKMIHLEIRVSELKGKWTWAFSYSYGSGGVSCGCSFHPHSTFGSREEAIDEAIKDLPKYQYWEDGDNCEWHLKHLMEFEASRKQYSLF